MYESKFVTLLSKMLLKEIYRLTLSAKFHYFAVCRLNKNYSEEPVTV